MIRNEPLQPGPVGWAQQHVPPQFDPARPGPLDWTTRHLPASIRVWGAFTKVGPPRLTEEVAFRAVRILTDDHVRRSPTSKRWRLHDKPETHAMVAWLRCLPHVVKWWSSAKGWRAPREFNGWRNAEPGPHLEPSEIAQMRLPDDVSMDPDVVLLQAWCQGMTHQVLTRVLLPQERAKEFWPDPAASLREGIRKLGESPYVQLAMAAPFMPPLGIDLGPGLVDSATRMGVLLKHPYLASLGELEIILRRPQFTAAYAQAETRRKRGKFVNPDGGWYACCDANALGSWFRRGATWTAVARGVE